MLVAACAAVAPIAAAAPNGPAATSSEAGSAGAGSSATGSAKTASPAQRAGSGPSAPKKVQDRTLRIVPGYQAGQASFTLHGRAGTRYLLALSGQGSIRPAIASTSVTTDRNGAGTAQVPVTLTADRIGGIVADISSTVAGQQRVTSSSVWLHPDKSGALVVGQSAVDAQLKATRGDTAARKEALRQLATAPVTERKVSVAAPSSVPNDRIQVHGTARWTDWAGLTHPARHINVVVTVQSFPSSYQDQTTTDDSGNYSFDMPSLDIYTDLQVRFEAQNAGSEVGLDGLGDFGGFGPYYKLVSASHITGGSSVALDMTAGLNGPWDVSFAIADSLWTAYSFGAQVTGSGAQSIMVDYPVQIDGGDTGAYTNSGLRRMTVADREWSAWDVLNHEYGHWFDSKHDISPLIGGQHCITDNLATAVCGGNGRGKADGSTLAWSEAFANFYSISASHYGPLPANLPTDVGDGNYDDDQMPSTGGALGGFNAQSDLSNPSQYYGEDNEFAIAGALFNLMDPDPSAAVYSEHTGIGVSLLYNELIGAHAQRLSDVVNAIWPSDTTSSLTVPEQNDFSCLLSAARVAPYWGPDYDPTRSSALTATLSSPPTISWQAGNGGNFTNNAFVVQAIDPAYDLPYFTSAGMTGTSWKPSRADWDLMTRGRGNSITVRVLGANSTDPYTGFYRGCANRISLTSTAVTNSSDCAATTLPANDDGSTAAVNLPFPVNFYGTTYTYLYVNNNGNVTFNAPLSGYTPFTITASTPPIIAPFFADVDTRGSGSAPVTYSYGTTNFLGHQAFCVNWLNVGYYSSHTDKLDSFQLLLVDRQDRGAGDFDIVFNYDSIQWETGDASGGVGGFGGTPAAVGFSAGTGSNSQFFQLPGSLQTHQFTDGDPHALAAGSVGALGNPGRYVFPVGNGQAPNSTTGVRGTVTSDGFGVADAPVQVCPHAGGHCVYQTRTGADGSYTALGMPAGSYDVKAFPPSGLSADPATRSAVTVPEGQSVTVDLALRTIAGPPPGTSIGPLVGGSTSVPVVNWNDPLTLSTAGCPGGTASYEILSLESGSFGQSVASGPLPEVSPGQYSTTIPPLSPHHGYAEVGVFIDCPAGSADETVTFDIYIDPSGTVLDQTGAPVDGATVTLLRSESADGPFTAVPNGSDLMSPANRNNPVLTDSSGRFGWDVVGGYYQVTATKDGCLALDGSATVSSPVYDVPPAITGIQLVLSCPVVDRTPPDISATPVTMEGNTTGGYSGTLPGVTASDPGHPDDLVSLTNDAPAVLPVGASSVTWTAIDAAGNRATASQQVTVADTTAPVLSCPPAVAGSYPSSPALGSATATDVVDPAPAVSNDAPASLPAGSTTVTWTATDRSGNHAACTQQVTLTAPVSPSVDVMVSADRGDDGRISTPAFSTTGSGELLVAILGSDGPAGQRQTATVTGAGLSWTLVERANAQNGDSEIWQAVAPGPLTNVRVRSTIAKTDYNQSLTVIALKNAAGIGAHAHASAPTGAPGLSLTPTSTGGLVLTGGEDWQSATARTLDASQSMLHEFRDTTTNDDYWVSRLNSATQAGQPVTVGAIAPTNDRWNLAAVEIVGSGG